jgi:hypothetical protein
LARTPELPKTTSALPRGVASTLSSSPTVENTGSTVCGTPRAEYWPSQRADSSRLVTQKSARVSSSRVMRFWKPDSQNAEPHGGPAGAKSSWNTMPTLRKRGRTSRMVRTSQVGTPRF